MYNIYKYIKGKHLLGRILGLSKNNQQGTIIGKDGNRYTFSTEDLKYPLTLEKDTCVEFETHNFKATSIHTCESCYKDHANMKLGIASVFITLIFGFAGTFLSYFLFAKQSFKKATLLGVLHLIASSLYFVPSFGLILYIGITLYFTTLNYKEVMSQ